MGKWKRVVVGLGLIVICIVGLNMKAQALNLDDEVPIVDSELRRLILDSNSSNPPENGKFYTIKEAQEEDIQLGRRDGNSLIYNIKDFTGLSYFEKMRWLNLSDMGIDDVEALSLATNLPPNLETVDIRKNNIGDLTIFRSSWEDFSNWTVYGQKIYRKMHTTKRSNTFSSSADFLEMIDGLHPIDIDKSYDFSKGYNYTYDFTSKYLSEVIGDEATGITMSIRNKNGDVNNYESINSSSFLRFTVILHKTNVVVKYEDMYGNPLREDVLLKGFDGEDYSTTEESFENYHLERVEGKTTGKFTDSDQVVKYVYDLDDGIVKTEHRSIFNELLDVDVLERKIGSNYTTEPKKIDGHELNKTPENANGVVKAGETVVIYLYKPFAYYTQTIEGKSSDGKQLYIEEKTVKDNTKYTLKMPKVVDGYKFNLNKSKFNSGMEELYLTEWFKKYEVSNLTEFITKFNNYQIPYGSGDYGLTYVYDKLPPKEDGNNGSNEDGNEDGINEDGKDDSTNGKTEDGSKGGSNSDSIINNEDGLEDWWDKFYSNQPNCSMGDVAETIKNSNRSDLLKTGNNFKQGSIALVVLSGLLVVGIWYKKETD